ncbi:hypothetical protein [Geoglobus acetivorans]|uniref:Uncharacterized protein n=1 Tax=Geoglobus acetivorans TaxID=565033 RepID=A0A0A7GCM3_GEOAI|nr:hypothetical protein GACE_0730 [Geoglobus acetivorans]
MKKHLLPIVLLLLIHIARADVIFPLTFVFIPYIPIIILLEVLAFLALRERLGLEIQAGRGILVVAIANIISSAAGLVVPGPYKSAIEIWFLSAYALSTLIEGVIYRVGMGKSAVKSVLLSAILNAVSYAAVLVAIITKML